jgi:hypothetical protein
VIRIRRTALPASLKGYGDSVRREGEIICKRAGKFLGRVQGEMDVYRYEFAEIQWHVRCVAERSTSAIRLWAPIFSNILKWLLGGIYSSHGHQNRYASVLFSVCDEYA